MGLDDWLLFLHVLAAFALVGSLVLYTVLLAALRRVDTAQTAATLFRVGVPANVLVGVGAMGTLIFGVWLAIYLDGYELWDGWILAALVLWAVSGALGQRTGAHYTAARKLAERGGGSELSGMLRARRPVVLHSLNAAAVLGILLLMIFKPGAP